MEKEYQKFHGLENAYVVRVVEGNGTPESIAREVQYVYGTDLCLIGVIDVAGKITKENIDLDC